MNDNNNALVIVESMNDGEVIYVVGPMAGEKAEEYRNGFAERYGWDDDLVYIGWAVSPEEVAREMEPTDCTNCGHEHDEHDDYGACLKCNCVGWNDGVE